MSDRIGPIDYDVETNAYRARYDPSVIAPSVALIAMLEQIVDCEADRLPQLYDVVDPDGLDRVLRTGQQIRYQRDLTVSFRYRDLRITASGDGLLEVEPIDDDRSNEG